MDNEEMLGVDYMQQRAEETEQFKSIDEGELDLSPWSLLSCDGLSMYDTLDPSKMIADEEAGKLLEKKSSHKNEVTIKPYITLNDLNNTKEEPYLNKPKQAIEIGIKVEF